MANKLGQGKYGSLQELEFLNSGNRTVAKGLQEKLIADGTYQGPTDGIVGRQTIEGLQRDLNTDGAHIAVDGIAGRETITALQNELSRRGFYHGNIDGIPGTETQKAIKTYFSDEKLTGSPVRKNQGPSKERPLHTTKTLNELSPQAEEVRKVAAERGEATFIMVDKRGGRIILFEKGSATLNAPALTGMSLADVVPEKSKHESIDDKTPNDRVTPAGKFSVTKSTYPEYGPLLQLNGIRGDNWIYAIHKVYTGHPSERREERLHSGKPSDSHISYGCINVDPKTINALIDKLPNNQEIPIYILPQDTRKTAEYFPEEPAKRQISRNNARPGGPSVSPG